MAHLVTLYRVQHRVLDEQRLTDVTKLQEQFERAEAESAEFKTQYLKVLERVEELQKKLYQQNDRAKAAMKELREIKDHVSRNLSSGIQYLH